MTVNHALRTQINIDGKATPLVARINRRAKRLILSVDPVHGEIRVTAPSKSAIPEAIDFAAERSEWIASQLASAISGSSFAENGIMPFLGDDYRIIREGGPRTRIKLNPQNEPRTIVVGGAPDHINRRLVDFLKREARNELTRLSDHYAARLGVNRGPIRIRDTRTRWGSCSSTGVLSFSWRLIMAPPEIINYVAAHECTHLVHMNHSPAFWRLLASLDVDARGATNWFAENGQRLFAYGIHVN